MKRILGILATLVLGVALMGCIGDGTHVVGTGIQPGTYQNSDSSAGCYWERLSGFGGTVEEIIANGFTYGPAVVTISPTDAGFTSARCGFWTLVVDAPTVVPPTAQPTQAAPTRTPKPTREPVATPEPDWNLRATCVNGTVSGSFDVPEDYAFGSGNIEVRGTRCDGFGHCGGGTIADFVQPTGHQTFEAGGIWDPGAVHIEVVGWTSTGGGLVWADIEVECN
jgi:hypothetical protein